MNPLHTLISCNFKVHLILVFHLNMLAFVPIDFFLPSSPCYSLEFAEFRGSLAAVSVHEPMLMAWNITRQLRFPETKNRQPGPGLAWSGPREGDSWAPSWKSKLSWFDSLYGKRFSRLAKGTVWLWGPVWFGGPVWIWGPFWPWGPPCLLFKFYCQLLAWNTAVVAWSWWCEGCMEPYLHSPIRHNSVVHN